MFFSLVALFAGAGIVAVHGLAIDARCVFTCPAVDAVGEALIGPVDIQGSTTILACGYDPVSLGNGEEAYGTVCEYDSTGAFWGGYESVAGACPASVSC